MTDVNDWSPATWFAIGSRAAQSPELVERIAAGASGAVDVLVGTNSDDWRLFPVLGGFIDRITDEATR